MAKKREDSRMIVMDDLTQDRTRAKKGAPAADAAMPLEMDLFGEPGAGAKIRVVGVGGGGGNAVNRMIVAGLAGVDFIAVNTDMQALKSNRAPVKMQIGAKLTKGLGCGANPDVGRQAALEDTERLIELLDGADMVFVTTGLGGGTGTGAAPVIANLASELGALVVAVVTKPFNFEGRRRRAQAERGLAELKQVVDTALAIPNEKLLHTVEKGTPLVQAWMMADDILRQAVQGISDLITIPGEINLDFADVRTIMKGMGMALLGTGVAGGERRAVEAAQRAISSPLLEDTSIDGAKGVLINVTGGPDITLDELLRRVRRELSREGWQLKAITTDNGAEFRSFEFQDAASELGIEQRFIRAARPQTNGAVERVQRTILEECWRPTFARSLVPRYTALRRDLQSYLAYYNNERAHTGHLNKGRTPAAIVYGAPKMDPR